MAEGISSISRDDTVVRLGIENWLREWKQDGRDMRVVKLARNPSNGFSNDSIFLTIEFHAADRPVREELVIRASPAGDSLQPAPRLEMEYRIQTALGAQGIPVAPPLAYVSDPSWIGTQFMVMPKIAGRVVPDNPPYSLGGWLHDASTDQQSKTYLGTLDILAALHNLDWRKADVGFLVPPEGLGLAGQLKHWATYIDWASDGHAPPQFAECLDWLRMNMPLREPPATILWGDARLGNIIFDDEMNPSAVLDWELATIGPAEWDIGYFLAYGRRNRELLGIPGDRDLPGFPGRAEAIGYYERRLGRMLENLEWYELFSMVRLASWITRVQGIMRKRGQLDHFVMKRPLMQKWGLDLMNFVGRAA